MPSFCSTHRPTTNALRSRKNPPSTTSSATGSGPSATAYSSGSSRVEDPLRIPLQVPERHGKAGQPQSRCHQLHVDARLHRKAAVNRRHREGAQLARRREGVSHGPPDLVADVAAKRMGETECRVRLVAVDDHRHEQAVERIPNLRVIGKSAGTPSRFSAHVRRCSGCRVPAVPC